MITPDADTLSDNELYNGFVCHWCGHPTIEHLLGQIGSTLICLHEDYTATPTARQVRPIVQRLPVFPSGEEVVFVESYEVDRRTCECKMTIGSLSFKHFEERHQQ